MKRVIQRKAKQNDCDVFPDTGDASKKQKRASQDIGNKTRKSAAMLGLALSMGASGSLLSFHSKGAVAAESQPAGVSSVDDGAVIGPDGHGIKQRVSDVPDAQVGAEGIGSPSSQPRRVASVGEARRLRHIIREGETLWGLSRRYGISSEELAAANAFDMDVVLRVGQIIVVPRNPDVLEFQADDSDSHLEFSSEVAETVASEQGVSIGNLALLQINKVSQKLASVSETIDGASELEVSKEPTSDKPVSLSDGIPPFTPSALSTPALSNAAGLTSDAAPASIPTEGQALIAQNVAFSGTPFESEQGPTVTDDSPALIEPDTHQIQVGETLADIARQYGISTQQLADANRIRNPNRIFAGRVLTLPPTASVADEPALVTAMPVDVEADVDQNLVAAIPFGQATFKLDESEDVVAAGPSVTEADVYVYEEELEATIEVVPTSPQPVESGFYVQQLLREIGQMSDDYGASDAGVLVTSPLIDSAAQPEDEIETETLPAAALDQKYGEASEELAYALPAAEALSPGFSQGMLNQDGFPSVGEEAMVDEDVSGGGSESVSGPSNPSAQDTPQLLASAPLGAENYVPLNQPVTGRMVSPDLPPLSGPENYLPSGSSGFNGFKYPAQGTLTSGYGWRWGRMHRGIDVAAPVGTPIVASAPGVVEFSGWNSGGYGNMVDIRHPDGSKTRYAHNSRNLVRVGQQVAQGEQIAEMGSTGYSTGPHVHFEIHLPDKGTVNPVAYLIR